MQLVDLIKLSLSEPTYIKVKIIPKSNRNEVVDVLEDDTIKIRIKAVPEKGKANQEVIKFISKELKINKTQISILSGKTDPVKLIKISN